MGSRYDQDGIPAVQERSEYQKAVDQVFEKYEQRMLDLMNRLRDGLLESGFKDVEEVEDDSADDYRKRFAVYESETEDTKKVDITLILAESQQYEGSDEGVTWRLEIVRWDGRILGVSEPFNYTPECWVTLNDSDAIEARWQLFEHIDASELPKLIREGIEK
jgi:hypothetical protein